jgi:ATP-binding cassette subfamily B protein
LGASDETKEVKIFGLSDITGRFKTLSDKFYSDNSKSVRRSIGELSSVLGTLAIMPRIYHL